jgi:hypothetical protein
LSSSDIDGLFTGLAVSNSLQVNRLSVDISEADSVIMPYVFSEIPPEGYEEGLRGLNTAFVRLEVSGSAGNIYKLIDEICALKAVLLKRLDWWPYYTGTVHESFYMRSEDDKTAQGWSWSCICAHSKKSGAGGLSCPGSFSLYPL